MKTWNVQRTTFKVADFIAWHGVGDLELSPFFQRRPVWRKGAKSYLIDTVMRGLPIPAIIIRDVPPDLETFRSRRQVVDGQQRLRTLLSFITPNQLADFQADRDDFRISRSHNRALANARFKTLPSEIRKRILDYQFVVHVFPSDTDDRSILEIFARMNATGYKLTKQELRNAKYFGEFKTSAFNLAAGHLSTWRSWHLFSEMAIARMAEVELVSELMILLLNGISEGNPATIDRFYKEKDADFPEREEVEKRINHLLASVDKHFLPIQRAPFEKKTLFYPFMAALNKIIYGDRLVSKSAKPSALSSDDVVALSEAGKKLDEGTAPASIVALTQRRVSQAGVRKKLTEYLLRRTSANAE